MLFILLSHSANVKLNVIQKIGWLISIQQDWGSRYRLFAAVGGGPLF